jgi:RES domain-containing protein
VYTSESASLAILETLVHASLQRLPKSLVLIRINVPDDAGVKTIAVADLPSDWRQAENPECVRLGSEWIRSKTNLVLRVPSATNPLDRNVLLNPLHADITRCEVSASAAEAFDPRLIAMFESPRS